MGETTRSIKRITIMGSLEINQPCRYVAQLWNMTRRQTSIAIQFTLAVKEDLGYECRWRVFTGCTINLLCILILWINTFKAVCRVTLQIETTSHKYLDQRSFRVIKEKLANDSLELFASVSTLTSSHLSSQKQDHRLTS